jgi:uncharacterized oligopeptide transporter (OPT) family protein
MGIAAMVELCGISSLAFAVGAYLPLSTTSPIFMGGLIKLIADKFNKKKDDSEIGPGALFSSGLIAGGALTGILVVSVCLSTYFLIKTVFLALGQKNETSLHRKGETEIHRGL